MAIQATTYEEIKDVTLKLLDYCRKSDWAGHDPYDALNSRLLAKTPFVRSRVFRIGITQFLKRLPINIRPLLLIPKEQNPKALALFLMAFVKLDKAGLLPDRSLVPLMVQRLIDLRSPNRFIKSGRLTNSTDSMNPTDPSDHYGCWGYSFPWQTRTILVPKGYPNLVCTTFVANALLDLYESTCSQPSVSSPLHGLSCASSEPGLSGEAYLNPLTFDVSQSSASSRLGGVPPTSSGAAFTGSEILQMAVSAAEYVLNDLYWSNGDACGFSYPLPGLNNRVHNANFLGAALLCRAYKVTGESRFLEPALKATRYSARQQRQDGSWSYGEHSTQQWVDNFHTGYNLCALRSIGQSLQTEEFEPHINRGFDFYVKHFFREDGIPKYFHDRTYPIDIHSIAQSIITLLTFVDLDPEARRTAYLVFLYAWEQMRNDEGYFYYQCLHSFKNRVPYMRWSQAWMLLALTVLLEFHAGGIKPTLTPLNYDV